MARDRWAAARGFRDSTVKRRWRLLAVALVALLALAALALSTSGARGASGAEPLPQPGHKLPPPGGMLNGLFGSSVALSGDGNTAIVGAPGASGITGKVLVFTRSGTVWAQQAELVGSEQIESGACVNEGEEVEEGGECRFGRSVALSADGNTALVGSSRDDGEIGAAWVFTRSGSTWTQQGPKLTGAGAAGIARFGKSVALSGDGNTALIGGPADRGSIGSVWVFARQGGKWAQQGAKLASGGTRVEYFGWSVALSGDGSTAIVGGPGAAERAGAAWVLTRSGTIWSPQPSRLTPDDEAGEGRFGYSVALSADGATALIGARTDHEGDGAAFAFTHSGGTWTQQGAKLKGEGEGEGGEFGFAAALSPDGEAALIGAPHASAHVGAAWEFHRSGQEWAQLGNKLTGNFEQGKGYFGVSVALSAGADSAMIGGPRDNLKAGAAWWFGFPPPPTVTSISPTSGPSAGGTSVTIHGSGFLPGAAVTIGSPATAVNVVSPTEITAVTAAHPAGSAEVVVSDENGTSSEGPTYTYLAPPSPSVKKVREAGGPEEEGNENLGEGGVLASAASALPPPKLAVTGNLTPVTGIVLVKLPGSNKFILLTKARQVPFGTIINAINGKVRLTTVGPKGRLQTITYYGGIFKISQSRNGQLAATLVGGDFSVCRQAKKGKGAIAAASRKSRSKRTVRKLWGDGRGSYSTKGNYAAGAVLGTRWLTSDRCDGTVIRVVTDKVRVTNLVNHRKVTVKAGQSYLAKAP